MSNYMDMSGRLSKCHSAVDPFRSFELEGNERGLTGQDRDGCARNGECTRGIE